VLILRSEGLLCRIDPAHGGEIVELVELRAGRQLLGRTPFSTSAPQAGDLDEETWTAGYRGGWQLLAPNAGNACSLDGTTHGFHGRASNDPWSVVRSDERTAVLAWTGHGLAIEREVRLEGQRLTATSTVTATHGTAQLVAAEHISFGAELLDPAVELTLPGGRVWEQSETTGPAEPPASAAEWPHASRLDGTTEPVDRLQSAVARTCFLALAEVPPGPVTLRNPKTGLTVALLWTREAFPFMWIWHENRESQGIWGGRTELLVIEAATVPHALGLATASDHHQELRIEPGQPRVFTFAVEVG